MRRYLSVSLAVGCILIISSFSAQADPIVVSPNRDARSLDQVGSSVTVISAEDIEKSQLTNVSQILREVPGVDVVRSGGRGGNTSIFLRGANSEHTLVVLDGIELNNPGNPVRAYNFSDLSLENIDRIEVLRGPQSSLYGSDAIGGVINIVTKSADPGLNLKVSSEAGSHSRFVQKARAAYGADAGSISLGITREDEDGISAADERDGNSEDDGFENTSFTLRAILNPSDEIKIENTFRYNQSKTDLDNTGGAFGDDPNRRLDNQQLFWRTTVSADICGGAWKPTVGVSLTDHSFDDDNYADTLNPLDTLDSRFSGSLLKIDWLNTIELSESTTVVAGLETEKEKASSRFSSDGAFGPFESLFGEEGVRNNGYFVDLSSELFEGFTTSAAVRLDDHDTFGSEVTYRISPVFKLSDSGTKIRGSVGTGFKAPSLNQLYSSFGNSELNPEESVGWEIGVDQPIADGSVVFGATYYRQNIDNLITFNNATFILENIEEVDISGFEVYVEVEPIENLFFRTDYTYLDAEDKDTNDQLIRRAENRVAAKVDYVFAEDKASAGLKVKYVGERDDTDFATFPASRVELGSYTVVDLLASYQATDDIRVFARVENLFDEEYQDVLGFGTYGVTGYGGIEVSL